MGGKLSIASESFEVPITHLFWLIAIRFYELSHSISESIFAQNKVELFEITNSEDLVVRSWQLNHMVCIRLAISLTWDSHLEIRVLLLDQYSGQESWEQSSSDLVPWFVFPKWGPEFTRKLARRQGQLVSIKTSNQELEYNLQMQIGLADRDRRGASWYPRAPQGAQGPSLSIRHRKFSCLWVTTKACFASRVTTMIFRDHFSSHWVAAPTRFPVRRLGNITCNNAHSSGLEVDTGGR